MYFTRYYNETEPLRSLTVLQDTPELPADTYIFIENFCADPACDCRKVMVNAASVSKRAILGTFTYGWEPLTYYAKWLSGDKELARDLKGPGLEPGGMQSVYAEALLEYFSGYVKEEAYRERLERHYLDFKRRLKVISDGDVCLCGSGEQWVRCCGRVVR